MANHWYVRNDGGSNVGTASTATATATTAPGTRRTGAWSGTVGDYFPDIETCFAGDDTVAPVAGDFIYVANDHTFTQSAKVSTYGASSSNTPVIILSVDPANQDQYLKGASETAASGGFDIVPAGNSSKVHFHGVDINVEDNIDFSSSDVFLGLCDMTLDMSSNTGNQINFTADGCALSMSSVTIAYGASATDALFIGPLRGNSYIEMNNVSVTVGAGSLGHLCSKEASNGGLTGRFYNCDFSVIGGYIMSAHGASTLNDDNMDIYMEGCKVNSTADPFVQEDFYSFGHRFLAVNCSDAAGEAEYQLYQKTSAGLVRDSGDDGTTGAIYRVESTAFSAGNKVSFKCTTTALCQEGNPLYFDLPTRFSDLTSASTDQITVYIATTATLTTANTWIEVSYPDATNKQTWKTTSSRAADILSATALTTDSGSDWENAGTDLTSENEYKITVATSSGAACVPHVKVFCIVPSITFYVDTTVDLS